MTSIKPLSNFDIIDKLKNIKNFHNVFMNDELYNVPLQKGFYIHNLNRSDQNGSHWTASAYDGNQSYYFDPFGSVPTIEIQKFLKLNGGDIILNTTQIQHLLSNACGWYCIHFVKEMNKNNFDYYSFINKFDLFDPLENEKYIKKKYRL